MSAGARTIVPRAPQELRSADRPVRAHSKAQIAQLKASIREFGFNAPVLVDEAGRIVAGHARVEAARQLGLASVPTIILSHLTPAQLRAYAIADNKLADNSTWDAELLRLELSELDLKFEFDLELTGFSTGELDVMLDPVEAAEAKLNATPETPRRTTTVERGDLWRLGDHRLLCGDAREAASYEQVMAGELAQMVFSDPPYNVPIDGFVGGLGSVKHAEFAMAAGEMSAAQFTEFLALVFANSAAVSVDGAVHYQCMDWRHVEEMMAAGRRVYSEQLNLCVWAKDSGGMGSFYRSQHELVFVWKVGTAPHLNNVELGKHGRYRTNVWNCRGVRKSGAGSELKLHPTVKPAPLIIDAIKDASRRGDIVLDPFGGSGSTLVAAEKARRKARLIEYEPTYCEVTLTRWQTLTKREAVLVATGETFEQVKARRAAEMEALADAALAEAAA